MHVIHDDGPGGGPLAVRHLIDFFRDDHDQIFVHGGSGIVASYCQQNGIPHEQIALDKKWSIPAGLVSLTRLMKRTKPDIVFLYGQWGGPVGALAGRMAGMPCMFYITHFPSFYTDWDLVRVIRNRIVEAIPCRYAARVITPSSGNYYQYLLRRLVSEEKALIINSSISSEEFVAEEERKAVRDQHRWSDEHCHVVSVARLADQKRTDWLLHSWKHVEQKRPEARLWIIGSGPDEAALKELARELQLSGCTFLGAQPRGVRFIGAADIVAMTSLYEGHAHVPLEAMLNGKPIVASDVDGVNNSFTDGREGFLVQPGNIELFAARIIELIDAPGRRAEMGGLGKQRAEQFKPETNFRQFQQLVCKHLS